MINIILGANKGDFMKKILTVLSLVAFLTLSFGSTTFAEGQKESPPPLDIVTDLLYLRPQGIFQTVIGAASFVISYPVTKAFKKTTEAEDFLVKEPIYFTFQRPLGAL